MALSSWFDHLDKLAAEFIALRAHASVKYPAGEIEVTPAPPTYAVASERMGRRMLTQTFISPAGVNDGNAANYPVGTLLTEVNIYSRDGHTAQHGEKIERNRLAALMCEQWHVWARDPAQYLLDAPTGRDQQVSRPEDFVCRNLSFVGNPSPDEEGLAHWAITMAFTLQSEPMVALTFEDLTRIDVALDGSELGGDNPDAGDDEATRVTYP
jgi:hypothetical protein